VAADIANVDESLQVECIQGERFEVQLDIVAQLPSHLRLLGRVGLAVQGGQKAGEARRRLQMFRHPVGHCADFKLGKVNPPRSPFGALHEVAFEVRAQFVPRRFGGGS